MCRYAHCILIQFSNSFYLMEAVHHIEVNYHFKTSMSKVNKSVWIIHPNYLNIHDNYNSPMADVTLRLDFANIWNRTCVIRCEETICMQKNLDTFSWELEFYESCKHSFCVAAIKIIAERTCFSLIEFLPQDLISYIFMKKIKEGLTDRKCSVK